jgi:hypothetical protein
MTDEMSCPTDDMIAVAKELRTFLEGQLAQHHQLFHNQPSSYHDLTLGLAQNIPQAGGTAYALVHTFEDTHTNIVNCYNQLFKLLDVLENGGTLMADTEHDVYLGFDQMFKQKS